MASDPRLDTDDEPPRWVRVWWPPVARLATFGVGALITIRPDASEAHILAGSGMMLLAAGFTVARWVGGPHQ